MYTSSLMVIGGQLQARLSLAMESSGNRMKTGIGIDVKYKQQLNPLYTRMCGAVHRRAAKVAVLFALRPRYRVSSPSSTTVDCDGCPL